jgi:glycosyltransferase involved in cell wall biosynthesis
MNILHGFSSAAGQSCQIARAQRELGHHAVAIHIGPNKMGYNFDKTIKSANFSERINLLRNWINEFDVFHFYGFPLFGWKSSIKAPLGLDLIILKSLNIPVIMNFRGSEVRQKDLFDKFTKFSFSAGEDHGLFKNFPSNEQRKYIKICQLLAYKIIVPDAELASYVPGAHIIPRAIDISKWKNYGQINSKVPLVVHAPTRRNVKGTPIILNAVERLKAKGIQFEFKLIEGLSNDSAYSIYAQSDIIIDQLKIGWHGVLSTEGMALGKVVMCYIREDLMDSLMFDGSLPLINVNEENLEYELENIILNPHARIQIANRARAYVEKVHDLDVVSNQLINIYKTAIDDCQMIGVEENDFLNVLDMYCSHAIGEKLFSGGLETPKTKSKNVLCQSSRKSILEEKCQDKVYKKIQYSNNERATLLRALQEDKNGQYLTAIQLYTNLVKNSNSGAHCIRYMESRIKYLKRKSI